MVVPPPPKNMLKSSSGLSSASNCAPFAKAVEEKPDREPIPLNLSSGSVPLSNAARFWGSGILNERKGPIIVFCIIPDNTWKALDTTACEDM